MRPSGKVSSGRVNYTQLIATSAIVDLGSASTVKFMATLEADASPLSNAQNAANHKLRKAVHIDACLSVQPGTGVTSREAEGR